jgi:membrane protease YdiL (CAAX protease family)
MKKINSLATQRPLVFGLVVAFVYIVMLVVSALLGNLWPGEETYGQPGGIVGRVISIIILLVVLSRLGWLRTAGFTRLGPWQTWLICLLALVYSIAGSAYALTGNIDFSFSDLTLSGFVTLFILTAAFMEQVAFRGLILHGFVRAWGSTNRGLIKSALISSLFFSGLHILDLASGRPLPNVLLQSVETFFLGVFFAALVLSGRSIYPAAFFHALFNLSAYLSGKGLEPAPLTFLFLSLLILPLALYGLYLLRDLAHLPSHSDSPLRVEHPAQ